MADNQNPMGMDPAAMPPFVSLGPLAYNPAEIEQQFYMFDRRCVGCVVLIPTRPLDTEKIGTVCLDDTPLAGCFFMTMDVMGMRRTMLGIPVRGLVGYGESHTLTLSGFVDVNGQEIDACTLPMTTRERPVCDPAYAAHDAVARQAAEEGMVLLKNEGVLPLKKDAVLNLFGDGITNFRNSATGAGKINPRYMRNLREAVAETSDFTIQPDLDVFYTMPRCGIPSDEILQRAKEASDLGILILTRGTGENIDCRPVPGEYYLTAEEEALLAKISETFAKTLVILDIGYPMDLRWIRDYDVDAVLYCGLAGQGASEALVSILDGRVNPSGHLTDSWTWTYGDNPANANFYADQVIRADDVLWVQTCYEEGIYVGYRYYETFRKEVAFPFGYGLSYTSFTTDAALSKATDGFAGVQIKVTNTGSVPGKAVAQLYVSLPETLQEQPARQLAGFAKTSLLAPQASETLDIAVDERDLATWDAARNAWVLSAGEYVFSAGDNVHDAAEIGRVTVAKERVLQQLTYRLPAPLAFEPISQKTGKAEATGEFTKLLDDQTEDRLMLTTERPRPLPETMEEIAGVSGAANGTVTWAQLKADPSLLDAFTAQLTDAQLARLNVMYGSGWSMDGKGEAGRMAPVEGLGMPDYICADGNSGVNLYKPNIGMPTSVVVCQTWNRTLAQEVGRVIGEEAAENDIQMILATAMNIHRAPLNGRQPEYFSEDPLLAGKMAASQVRGLHAAGISDSVKHVACNNCETARKRNHSIVDERALREIYLRAFAVLIREEAPDTIMTAYNALNGSMCGSDSILVDGIFRQELGFDGFAMTDWNSYDTVDVVEAARAGISWLTPGENDGSISGKLEEAVADGRLPREVLQRNARRVFAVMLRRLK